jgi:hypothetical protein
MAATVHVFTGGLLKFWVNKAGVANSPQANAAVSKKGFFMADFFDAGQYSHP